MPARWSTERRPGLPHQDNQEQEQARRDVKQFRRRDNEALLGDLGGGIVLRLFGPVPVPDYSGVAGQTAVQ